jgi:hypothetical protein
MTSLADRGAPAAVEICKSRGTFQYFAHVTEGVPSKVVPVRIEAPRHEVVLDGGSIAPRILDVGTRRR